MAVPVFAKDSAGGGTTWVTNANTGYSGGVLLGGEANAVSLVIVGDSAVAGTVGIHEPKFQFEIPDSQTLVVVEVYVDGVDEDVSFLFGPSSLADPDTFNMIALRPQEIADGQTLLIKMYTELQGGGAPGDTQKVFWTLSDINYLPGTGVFDPGITILNANVTTTAGQPISNTGTYTLGSTGQPVTITSSIGTVTPTGPQVLPGTWIWSFANPAEVDEGTVTMTVSDGGNQTQRTFELIVDPAIAGDIYVSGSGNDGNPGTKALPKETIQAGIDAAANGETVLVERGYTYTDFPNPDGGQVHMSQRVGVTLAPYGDGASPIMDGQDATPHTSIMPDPPHTPQLGLFEFRDCQNCTIRGFHIKNSKAAGIMDRNSWQGSLNDNNTIEENLIEHTRAWGILSKGTDWNASDTGLPYNSAPIIRYNEIRDVCEGVNLPSDLHDNSNGSEWNSVGNAGGEGLTLSKTQGAYRVYGNRIHSYNKEGLNVNNSNSTGNPGWVHHNIIGPRNPTHTDNNNSSPPQGTTAYSEGTGSGLFAGGASEGCTGVRMFSNEVKGDAEGMVISSESGGDVDDIHMYNNVVHSCHSTVFGMIGNAGNGPDPGVNTNCKIWHNLFHTTKLRKNVVKFKEVKTDYIGLEFCGNIVMRPFPNAGTPLRLIENFSGNNASGFDLYLYEYNILFNGGASVTSYLGATSQVLNPSFENRTFPLSVFPGGTPSAEKAGVLPQLVTSFYPAAGSAVLGFVPTPYTPLDIAGNTRPSPAAAGPFERP